MVNDKFKKKPLVGGQSFQRWRSQSQPLPAVSDNWSAGQNVHKTEPRKWKHSRLSGATKAGYLPFKEVQRRCDNWSPRHCDSKQIVFEGIHEFVDFLCPLFLIILSPAKTSALISVTIKWFASSPVQRAGANRSSAQMYKWVVQCRGNRKTYVPTDIAEDKGRSHLPGIYRQSVWGGGEFIWPRWGGETDHEPKCTGRLHTEG